MVLMTKPRIVETLSALPCREFSMKGPVRASITYHHLLLYVIPFFLVYSILLLWCGGF